MSKQVQPHGAHSTPNPAAPKEWIRPKEVIARFGIGRNRLYALIAEGKIESLSLHSQGEKRGTRIIRLASLTAYLENLLAESRLQQQAVAAHAISKQGAAA